MITEVFLLIICICVLSDAKSSSHAGGGGGSSSSGSSGSQLSCFICSERSSMSCPSAQDSPDTWSADSNKYVANGFNTKYSCVIGFSTKSGKTYFQSYANTSTCASAEYQSIIVANINSVDPPGTAICCNQNGCNWNSTYAQNNVSIGMGTAEMIGLIVLGVVLLIFMTCCCCFCCCIMYWSAKNKSKNIGNNNRINQLSM